MVGRNLASLSAFVLAGAALESETRARVSRPVPFWWRQIGHLWASRAWESGAPDWGRPLVWRAARATGVPAALLAAVIYVESRWKSNALSPAGAIGLMQLMPATARELGVDPRNPIENLGGGARYLRALLERLGSAPRALAAYNAGPSRAALAPEAWPPETQAYVAAVLDLLSAPPRRDFGRIVS